jgi:multidrug efflux pump subunit AcrA (membrane-fusion protein)
MEALADFDSNNSGRAPPGLIAPLIAAALSAGAILAAALFGQAPPLDEERATDAKIDSRSVTLVSGADAVGVAATTFPGDYWSAPHPARVLPDEQATAHVWAPAAGHVSRVFVELGDRVKQGDKLFSMAARAGAFAKAERELTVLAPRAGTIVRKAVRPWQRVDTDDSLIDVADLSMVWAVADVFESEASNIQLNSSVLLTGSPASGISREAQVTRIGSVVDPQRQTLSVRATLPNPDQLLSPNAYIEMRFHEPELPGAVEVPASAVLSDGVNSHVYVQEGTGHFVRRDVRTAWSRASKIVVTGGLRLGDLVVERGAALIDELAFQN